MEIPEAIDNFLIPLPLTQAVDEKRLPANLSRQFSSIVNHFQNKRGNVILFSDGSTTENELAVNLLAKQVGQEVYRMDLSGAASRHLGETEKHLLQVFEFAAQHGFVLLFDEADSLFGKRSDVRTSHDRFSNLELSYLLKRIAAYPGLVVFTTNADDHLDDALLSAALWQIDLSQPAKQKKPSFWQRLFNRS